MSCDDFKHQFLGRLKGQIARLTREQVMLALMAIVLLAAGLLSIVVAIIQYRSSRTYYAGMLAALWSSYKQHDWQAGSGRTIDVQDGGITTSESQAYTMMRAVWSNDPVTFAKTWNWTAANLQRQDGLFSWRWGALPGGGEGVQVDRGGNNTASDADTDIAVALLMAGAEWHRNDYANAAKKIIPAIWNTEVVKAHGQLYMAADNLEKESATSTFVINPSYIAPYAYRLFAGDDTQHDWQRLADDSYTFLFRACAAPLDTHVSAGLPPGWVRVDKVSGALEPPAASGQSTDFGYDAFRMYWRVGLDGRWFGTASAQQLIKLSDFLDHTWASRERLAAVYSHAGRTKVSYESLALYGGSLAYFDAVNNDRAAAVVSAKIAPLYDAHTSTLRGGLSYYDNNWLWFGLAYQQDLLPDVVGRNSA